MISGSTLIFNAPNAGAAPPSYAQAVLADNPVAYWQFADPSGSPAYADSSGNGNTLRAGSTTLVSPGVGGADGAISTAAGGTYTTSSLTPLVDDASRTVEAWFETTSGGCVLSAGAAGHSQSFSLCFGDGPSNSPTPGVPGFYLQTWDADIFMPIAGMTDGNWHYLGLTLSGSTVNIVIDGQQPSGYVWNGSSYSGLTTQPFLLPFTPNTTASPLGIGTPGWTEGLSGTIDEIAVYPIALSPNQLIDHYQLMTTATPLAVITTSLPGGVVGQTYSAKLAATGGTRPYTWSIPGGEFLPTGLSLNGSTGAITGKPIFAGTLHFTVIVTDSSSPTATAPSTLLSIAVSSSQNAAGWNLLLNQNSPPVTSMNGGPVVVNPHVAYVLVGNWWCPLFASAGSPPSICTTGSIKKTSLEQSNFVAVLSSLVTKDYNSSYDNQLSQYYEVTGCGFLGSCTTTYVGHGVTLRYYSPYGGTAYAGPLSLSQVNSKNLGNTLNSLTGAFGIHSQTDVNNTVFVLLYAPNQLTCGNPSVNFMTGPGGPGVFGSFVVASVYLEDVVNSCQGDLPSTVDPPTTGNNYLTQWATQFATWAVSHELDEAITSPGASNTNTTGWLIAPQGWQIADPCHTRNADGETSYVDPTNYPYENFTRDSLGTVVAAYVSPTNPAFCSPDVSSSIPPQLP